MFDPNAKKVWNFFQASNDLVLSYILEHETPRLISNLKEAGADRGSILFEHDGVLSYSVLERGTGKIAKSDSIYQSIESLVKAASYKLSKPKSNKYLRFFTIELLSLLRGKMVRLNHGRETIAPSEENIIRYYAKHIVHGTERDFRVCLATENSLEAIEAQYSKLHEQMCTAVSQIRNEFFERLPTEQHLYRILTPYFRQYLLPRLNLLALRMKGIIDPFEAVEIFGQTQFNPLTIVFDTKGRLNNKFFQMQESNDIIREALWRVYHYQGPFRPTTEKVLVKLAKSVRKDQ